MTNTVTLSSDLTTLYVIGEGGTIATYALDKPEGVVLELNGDNVIANAGKVTTATTGTDATTAIPSASLEPGARSIKFLIGTTSQYTTFYNRATRSLGLIGSQEVIVTHKDDDLASRGIIGSQEVIVTRTVGDENSEPAATQGTTEYHVIDLTTHQVRIRRVGESLVIDIIKQIIS